VYQHSPLLNALMGVSGLFLTKHNKCMKKNIYNLTCSPKRMRRKIWLIMKLTGIILLAGIMQLSAAVYSQKHLTLKLKDAKLIEVFAEIKAATGYTFVYNTDEIETKSNVSVNITNGTLQEVLDKVLNGQGLKYTIVDNVVVISSLKISTPLIVTPPPIIVKGRVINEQGEALLGATVVIKGTPIGATTDKNGRFTLKIPEVDVTLVITYIGYQRQEVITDGKTELTITLKSVITSLVGVDIVSTGYQDIKKLNFAGSATSIKATDLTFNGTNTLEQALQGKLTGLVIQNTSGLVGTRQKTMVRGQSTLLGSQDPIWVVDGIIQEDPLPFKVSTLNALGGITPDNFDYVRNFVGNAISWLNPLDIEDITILKDASATAIYGVRATNGVIVINRKKGKSGPPIISYSTSVNIGEKVTYDRLNMMNSKERVAVSKEIWDRGLTASVTNNNIGYAGELNDYLFGRSTYDQFNANVSKLETVNVNWFNLLFRVPISTNHSISLSGGNENTQYYSSFGYSLVNGTAIGNDSKSYTANMRVTSRLTDKINISATLAVSQANTNGFYSVEPYKYAAVINRSIPAFDTAGDRLFYRDRTGYLFNIMNERDNSGSTNKNFSVNTNFNLNYDIIKGLRFSSLFSINQSIVTGDSYASQQTAQIAALRRWDYGTVLVTDPAYISSQIPMGGIDNQVDNRSNTWNFRNSLSYSHVFNAKHAFTVMIGQDVNSTHLTGFSTTQYGYMPERGSFFIDIPSTITTNASVNPLLVGQPRITLDRLTNNAGGYGTMNYSYDNRYAINFSIRTDASNRFGQFTGERFKPVYAGGLRWNVTKEKWAEKINQVLSNLSFRTSFGYQRNIISSVSPDLIARVPLSPASEVYDLFTGEPRLLISSLPYGNLRWEKKGTLNLGVDFGFINNRISGTFEYYFSNVNDLIVTLPVPTEYGVASMPKNGGSMTNSGIELGLNFVAVRSKDYTLNITFNTSKTYNQLTNTGNQTQTWTSATSGGYFADNFPVTGFWAFDFKGINPQTGYPIIDLAVADGKDPKDPTSFMKYVGKKNPDLTAGFGLNFRYKMLSFSSGMYLQLGGKTFLSPAYNVSNTPALPNEYDNLSRELLQRWTPANTTAMFPGLPDAKNTNFALPNGEFSNPYVMYNYSTARVVNATSLRINNINVNYTLPVKISNMLRCRNVSAGFGVSNPFYWVSKDFKGIDPEVATGAQPRARSYSFHLNVSF